MNMKIVVALACLALYGCNNDVVNANNGKQQVQEKKDDIIDVYWKMLSGNSYIYFTTFEVDGHKYIVATRSCDSIALQHAASCPCRLEK